MGTGVKGGISSCDVGFCEKSGRKGERCVIKEEATEYSLGLVARKRK